MVKAGLGITHIAGIAQGFPLDDLSILQPDPFQVISQDQVAGQSVVFGDLLGPQNLVQIFPDLLAFQIAEDALVMSLEFEIRSAFAGLVTLGFVNDFDFLSCQDAEKMVQGRAQGVLGGIFGVQLFNLLKICFEVFDHNGILLNSNNTYQYLILSPSHIQKVLNRRGEPCVRPPIWANTRFAPTKKSYVCWRIGM